MSRSNENTSHGKRKLRIAICGGGIGGLALASTLGRYQLPDAPLEVHLYEAAKEISTVGAGISVWPRTWRVLELLGLQHQVAKASVEPPTQEERVAFTFRRSDRGGESYTFYKLMVPCGATTMHRADMVDILRQNFPSSYKMHTSKHLVSYSEFVDEGGTGIRLLFADGEMREADVLVGADGVRSATRETMYRMRHAQSCQKGFLFERCERCKAASPKWSGTVAYRALIETEKLRAINPKHEAITQTLSYSGKNKHIITYPISQGRLINFVGFVTVPGGEGAVYPGKWVHDVAKEEVTGHYRGWEHPVDEILQCIEKPSCWAVHRIDDLPSSVSGSVALLGDAVHAMETHQGAGAGQAIEDAYILGRLLAPPLATRSRIQDILRIYEAIRLPFGRNVCQQTRRLGKIYEFNAPGFYDRTTTNLEDDTQQLRSSGEAIRDGWKWQWEIPFDEQWNRADRKLMLLDQMLKGKSTAHL